MSLVNSFLVFLQSLSVTMTGPTFNNWCQLTAGWVFAPRRTITGMLSAAGLAGRRHHACFHRLFAAAQWSLDQLGLAVFRLLLPVLNGTIVLAVDDTLARKRSRKIYGVGMHLDPLISTRKTRLVTLGHSWVVLGVIVHFSLWPERAFCLPLLFRLYLTHAQAEHRRKAYRTRPELAVQMLHVLCRHAPGRRFHLLGDSAYGGQNVLNHLPANCGLTSRLLMNARLYDALTPTLPRQRGGQRKRGPRLPTPQEMLHERAIRADLEIYGRHDPVRYCETTARLHSAPGLPVRVVAVEPLRGGRRAQAFYSTCATQSGLEVLKQYSLRWAIEVAFHDSKQSLGFEEPQGWTRRAVERTAPTAMLLYSLIVRWYTLEGHAHWKPLLRPWYHQKHEPSFHDMLATLRCQSLRQEIDRMGLSGPGSRKIIHTLETMLSLSA